MNPSLDPPNPENEALLRTLAAVAFLIFFNGYIVAPLIPSLAHEFGATDYQAGWVVPAYMIPYGLSTIVYGSLADRFGRRRMLLGLLVVATITTIAASFAWSIPSLIAMRVLGGLGSGGVVTVALAVVGDLFPYKKLGRAMGWVFGAVAGGMAFGSTLGAWLNPILGWRYEFVALAGANLVVLALLARRRRQLSDTVGAPIVVRDLVAGYASLLRSPRGGRTYAFIFANGVFHGGVFAWLGFYLHQRYGLTVAGIGRSLLGYGIPGMFLGPTLGKLADRFGRRRIIPLGFLVAAACALALIPTSPLWMINVFITCLSVGLDMSHPLMAGIVASLDPKRRGQAMGLNTFAVFCGFGVGAALFQNVMLEGLVAALAVFGGCQLLLGLVGFHSFKKEVRA